MSDDDLFASDSDDTAELMQQTAAAKKPKKKPADSSGLFDSSDDDDSDADEVKKSSKKKPAAAKEKKPMSKREKLEAMAQKKRKETGGRSSDNDKEKDGKKGGYESGDSYDSAEFQRTAEDDAFLDTTGEDADAVNELYAEQKFGRDERPDEEGGGKKRRRRHADDEAMEDNGDNEPDNPIMAAVHRMKKKKREKKTFSDLEAECKSFLGRMELAAEEDEEAVRARTPATNKLKMLTEVVDTLYLKDRTRMLLDLDFLSIVKLWIQPLPNGKLGNVTIRQRLLSSIAQMTGEAGINPNDLKRSELGKTVMSLYKHRDETPALKRQLKNLVEQWSRPIFQKSGNMRDLERVHHFRGEGGLASVARSQMAATGSNNIRTAVSRGRQAQDLGAIIASGKQGGSETGVNRVRVPFSKGFAYSVRPGAKTGDVGDDKRIANTSASKDNRGKLSKRMMEKSRPKGKNQRSANISVEGRKTK